MHKALHPRNDIERLYPSRKEGKRGHASIPDNVNSSIRGLKDNPPKKESKQRKFNDSGQKQHKRQQNDNN